MGNKAMSFAVSGGGSNKGSIQAAQGQRGLIASQGLGAQRAGPIEQQQQAPPDGWGDDSDCIGITENNPCWWWWDRDGNWIGS
jgi:hypothetical protein